VHEERIVGLFLWELLAEGHMVRHPTSRIASPSYVFPILRQHPSLPVLSGGPNLRVGILLRLTMGSLPVWVMLLVSKLVVPTLLEV
jgi:hypothetical protein